MYNGNDCGLISREGLKMMMRRSIDAHQNFSLKALYISLSSCSYINIDSMILGWWNFDDGSSAHWKLLSLSSMFCGHRTYP